MYILDFEEVLKHFTPYHESLKKIQTDKQEFSNLIEGIKKEMESIVNSSKSLILDDVTNQSNQMKFRELQKKAVEAESDFRSSISVKQNEELEKNFQQVIDIVNIWAESNNIDIILNKNTVVFTKPEFEITNKIIELIKEKNLYQEYKDGMYEVLAN